MRRVSARGSMGGGRDGLTSFTGRRVLEMTPPLMLTSECTKCMPGPSLPLLINAACSSQRLTGVSERPAPCIQQHGWQATYTKVQLGVFTAV